MTIIPESHADLLAKDKKAFAHLATVNADGTPQNTPVWIDFDGRHLLFNTARGRVKDRNLSRDPHVALSIQDPDQPYRYLQIQGRVIGTTEEGADAHIDALAKKYMGVDRYPMHTPTETRVIYRIEPEKVQTMG